MQQSSIHYKNIKVMTNLLIHNVDSLKISYKKRMFCGLPHHDAATYSYP